jgi:hypothetical protein
MRVHRTLFFFLAFASSVVTASCSSSSSNTATAVSPDTTTITQPIGPTGGTINVAGATVTFPAGAVAADTKITISVDPAGVPAGYVALSKLFKCEPSGTEFAKPVEMRMPFTDDGKGGTLFWSSGADPTFKDLGGRIEGTTMVATVQHFSSGFVGRPSGK